MRPSPSSSLSSRRKQNRFETRATFEQLERRQLLASAVAGGYMLDLPAEATYVGPAKFFYKTGSYLSARSTDNARDIALNWVKANPAALGLAVTDVRNAFVADSYQDGDTGISHVYLKQAINGIVVQNSDLAVNVMRDGRILSVSSNFVSLPKVIGSVPALSVSAGLQKAAQGLELRLTKAPTVLQAPQGTKQQATLQAGEVSTTSIPAEVHYVATSKGIRLAWDYSLNVPGGQAAYNTHVDAASGELLYTTNYTSYYIQPGKELQFGDGKNSVPKQLATGSQGGGSLSTLPTSYNVDYNVYGMPLASPSDGPRSIKTNPWDTPSPFGWHDTDGDTGAESNLTLGNNADAHEDRDANDTGGIRANGGTLNPDGSGNLSFDFPIDFTQEPTTANNQLATISNLFYWNNTLHDIYYRYGFTEAARNFQENNYGNGGAGGDLVQADAQDGSGTNNANFTSNTDGTDGRMQMYLFTAPTPDRDGDLDAEVMSHEYGHGVSNRMSGTGSGLSATQSRGMGEGWGDYFGLMLTLTDGSIAAQNAAYPVGTYVLNQPLNGAGIRRRPYSYDMAIDDQTFAWYGTGGQQGGSTEVHNTGELWVGALWDMSWNLIRKYGFNSDIAHGYGGTPENNGNTLAMKLVFEGIKGHGANPSFIQARDAILAADQALNGGQDLRELWLAFARRGLGFSASTTGSTSTTFTEAFDLPPTLLKPFVQGHTPNGTVVDQPLTNITINFSRPMDTTSFSVVDDVQSFSGPGGNMMNQITGFSWTNSQTLVINFNTTRANGAYSMVIGPNILAPDGTPMDQNSNNTAGEPGDVYNATFTKTGSGGPRISAMTPSGSISTATFSTIDVTFTEAMDQSSFSVASDVTSFTGPGGVDLKSQISGFTWQNATTLRLNMSPQRAVGNYSIVIGPSVLANVDGTAMDQNSNGSAGEAGDTFSGAITKTGAAGPRITSQTPTGAVTQPTFASIDLIFSEAMDQTSFNVASDVVSFFGPGGSNLKPQISGFTWQNATTLRINFASQGTDGTYSLTLAPSILAAIDGAAMDQNSNGTAGEAADNYTGNVTLDRFPGPDGGGYEASPVPLTNIDLVIGAPGVITLVNGQDDLAGTIALPAGTSFTYYGQTYTSVFPNTNGLITFGTSTTAFTNTDLTASPTQAAIAVAWDDWHTGLQPTGGGPDSALLYQIVGNDLIIEWSDVPRRINSTTGTPSAATFQAILKLNTTGGRNGDVILNFPDLNTGNVTYDEAGNATVGIKNTGTQGASRLLIAQDTVGGNAFVGTGKALRFTATKASGVIFADDNGDGVLNGTEQPVPFAHIYRDANNNSTFDAGEAAVFADQNGAYAMTSLFDGDNFLRIDLGDYINTQPNPSVNLLMGENGTGRNIGVFNTALVGAAGADSLTVSDNGNRTDIVQSPGRSYSILDAVLNKLSWDGLGGGDTLSISSGPSLKLIGNETLDSLTINNGASAYMPAGTSSLLVANTLAISGGTLDLGDNDMIVDYTGASQLAAIQSLINSARSGGTWSGTGITSSAAKDNALHNTTLGAIEGSDYPGATFNGVAVPAGTVLVKYTYYGDTDFNGIVNFDDYSRTDAGFNSGASDWFHGDFDGNGLVNFDDYSLIDLAFNTQGSAL